ncbi:A24 family peptidase [Methylobrevis albus]|uniref:Prepilin peptidase n=1 Tax=Methylobrevis albus TaxID=2793297 RepID=A0A931I1F3_9HYPH|nr:prepilin peptidase [Methylobrevis albus]MBH0238455.1 prepilin peptidase [Methylobrevis albus]
MLQTASMLFFPAAMAYAAASDLLTMTISNRISLALIAVFLVIAPLTGLPWPLIGVHVLLAAGVLVGTFVLFNFGWIGGGDAKLAAAIVLWLGPSLSLPFFVWTALTGGGLTLALMIFRRVPLPAVLLRQPWIARLYSPEVGVPYGIALAAGGLIVFPQSVWFTG